MAQNKISRRSFLRGAGASATIAAASCMAPSAAACDIKSLWSCSNRSRGWGTCGKPRKALSECGGFGFHGVVNVL